MLHIIETDEQLIAITNKLAQEELLVCDLETSGLDIRVLEIEGIGIGTATDQMFLPVPHNLSENLVTDCLTKLFEKPIIFHNAKFDLKVLLKKGYPIPNHIHDTLIMSWLIDENGQHGLKALAKVILGKEPKEWKELQRTEDLFTDKEDIIKELAEYCAEDVINTMGLYRYFHPLLEKEGVLLDYERVEMPFVKVLASMELRGIRIDVPWLIQKQSEARKILAQLDVDMKAALKGKFPNPATANFRSVKDLERILFDGFRYESVLETKAGKRSTSSDALIAIVKKNKLQPEDFVPMLLKFRDLDKLYGTYLVGLAEQAGMESIVHTNFKQHGTRTGRLSSDEPNLQNIPSRKDEWNVRQAFIPRDGHCFIIADYSQIELRMLAHFSKDKHMTKTFVDGGDIHATTMQLTGITERRVAKGVNFGIVYGVGPRTLSALIEKSEAESKEYIDAFFAGYPEVKFFIQRVQHHALQKGYVEMITGRKRRFHEFKDQRWFSSIARQSINTKIQGSAADLIKVAMIKMKPALHELGAYQLVQIHDELIVEAPIEIADIAQAKMQEIMETALTLRVPIVANIQQADRWVK